MTEQITGRMSFNDGPYDVLPRPPLPGGEVLVMAFPPGTYRLETGSDGVRLFRRDPAAATIDARSVLQEINARNRAFYRVP